MGNATHDTRILRRQCAEPSAILRHCSLCVVPTYVRVSCVALPNHGQFTYTKNLRLKCEQHECCTNLGQHSFDISRHMRHMRTFRAYFADSERRATFMRHSYICLAIILQKARVCFFGEVTCSQEVRKQFRGQIITRDAGNVCKKFQLF